MKKWNKKPIDRETVRTLCSKYGVNSICASIMARRGIIDGDAALYFKESDERFLRSPFLIAGMEDAVDRIRAAEDEGEKVLVFGDRDVDGVSATAILFGCLSSRGMDVSYRLPSGNETYGLSTRVIDDFAAQFGTLIVTVDCGISNAAEIAYAAEKGIDVIVTDHHNPPEILPDACVTIDPKLPESRCAFKDISGAAVAFKLAEAIRFSDFDFYKEEIALLDARPSPDGGVAIECVKTRNLVSRESLSFDSKKSPRSVIGTPIPDFLRGQQIFAWDVPSVQKNLAEAFGTGVDFNMMDLRPLASRMFPSLERKSLSELKEKSRVAFYSGRVPTEIDGFYNLFVTFALKKCDSEKNRAQREGDLQLAMLAALADVMPLLDENRIFARSGLALINGGKIRRGLAELFARLSIVGKKVTSTDMSWTVIPALNAAGRLGQPEIALELLLSDNAKEREDKAQKIIELNEERKRLVYSALGVVSGCDEKTLAPFDGKMRVVVDEKINKGITGIVASRLSNQCALPVIVVSFVDDKIAVGSLRAPRGFNCADFLCKFGDIFLNHGGHDAAAGFSFERRRLDEFLDKAKSLARGITSAGEDGALEVDAELPADCVKPDIMDVVDFFEPYGEKNRELVFLSRALPIADAIVVGKKDSRHLKLSLACGGCKFPAMFWGEGDRLNRDVKVGDKIDILYSVERNTFNGASTPQIIIKDMEKSV